MSMTSAYGEQLGGRIVKAREAANIGLRELARKADISPSYLCEIEQGESIPSADKIQRIAKALKIKLANLLPES